MSKSDLEAKFEWQLFALGYRPWSEDNPAGYRREWVFHPHRKWRLDFAWPDKKVAVEVDGVRKPGSAHRSYYGVKRDIRKGNQAMLLGWKLLRLTDSEIRDGSGARLLETLLEGKAA